MCTVLYNDVIVFISFMSFCYHTTFLLIVAVFLLGLQSLLLTECVFSVHMSLLLLYIIYIYSLLVILIFTFLSLFSSILINVNLYEIIIFHNMLLTERRYMTCEKLLFKTFFAKCITHRRWNWA